MPNRTRKIETKRKKPAPRKQYTATIRIKPHFAEQLRKLAQRNGTNLTAEGNRALRELLEKERLLPRPKARLAQ